MATKIVATRKRQHGDHRHVSMVKTLHGTVYTRAEAADRISNGWEAFYTEYMGYRANVYVRRCTPCGIRFITTKPDGTTKNNLLQLPDF